MSISFFNPPHSFPKLNPTSLDTSFPLPCPLLIDALDVTKKDLLVSFYFSLALLFSSPWAVLSIGNSQQKLVLLRSFPSGYFSLFNFSPSSLLFPQLSMISFDWAFTRSPFLTFPTASDAYPLHVRSPCSLLCRPFGPWFPIAISVCSHGDQTPTAPPTLPCFALSLYFFVLTFFPDNILLSLASLPVLFNNNPLRIYLLPVVSITPQPSLNFAPLSYATKPFFCISFFPFPFSPRLPPLREDPFC